jgi:hypothetical protein
MLPVEYTGIRDDEYITSAPGATQNKGTIMQIKGSYPPSKLAIKNLSLTDIRDKLSKIHFFIDMTPEERKAWLKGHATDNNDLYIDELDIQVRFIAIDGKDMNTRLTTQQKTVLLQSEYVDIKVVSKMLGKPGSKARRPTLIFRPNNWAVMADEDKTVQFQGILININVPSTAEEFKGTIEGDIAIIEDVIAIIDTSTDTAHTQEDIDKLLAIYPASERIKELMWWASPSIFKSLIQKLVRTRAVKVIYLDETFAGVDVLVTAFIMLLQHPGVFDTDFQEFTTGLESACKRLGVTIAEDSHVQDSHDLMSLFAAGYYAKINKRWKPSMLLINDWIRIALKAHENVGIYKYKFNDVELPVNTDPLSLCYHIIIATKALVTDIPMVGWIAKNKGELDDRYTAEDRLIIPLVHCIDHHNITDIAWHVQYKYLIDQDYPTFFRQVWKQSSSINARKGNYTLNESGILVENAFVKRLRVSQYEVWALLCCPKEIRELAKKKVNVEYKLDDTWIAGLIGVISVKIARRDVKIVIDANDIHNFVTVVRPRRGESSVYILSDEEKASAIQQAEDLLKNGIKVKTPPSLTRTYPTLSIKLRKGVYYIHSNDEWIPWDIFKTLQIHLHVCASDMQLSSMNACLYTNDNGIEKNYVTKIKIALDKLNGKSKSRLLTYIDAVVSRIDMYKIQRSGKAVGYEVAIEDTAVYQFLCALSVIVPAALEPYRSSFKVKNGPLMWNLIDVIRTYINAISNEKSIIARSKDIVSSSSEESTERSAWEMPVPDEKILYQHQRDALEGMLHGGNRHLIYITPGLGKTLILINYIMELIRMNLMPKYCVYALPSSAYEGVSEQFEAYHIDINLLNMNKNIKTRNYIIIPYCINFIKHDHMRKGNFLKQASKLANSLMFTVDEFHLTLAKTKRTTAALSIARIAKYFVGMTGTIIKDDNPEDLIAWLSLISKFEVTKDNYWVAIGSMISNRIETKIAVKRINIHIDLTKEQQREHNKSFNDAVRVCYQVVMGGIIEQALHYINKGEGVFIVAKDNKSQDEVERRLLKNGVKRIFKITSETPITYKPDDKRKLQAIITTIHHSTGYTITGMHIMITSVYFSNQATRDQLNARLNRIGQPSLYVKIITVHCGLLSYVLEKYEGVRTLAEAMKSFAAIADVDPNDV